MSRRFLFLMVAGSSVAPMLSAQVRDTTRLGELVVTATRSPLPLARQGSSADLFRPEELARRQVTSLQAALQLAPGGTLLSSGAPGAIASLFLRGVASTQTLFLLDGIRVNDANINPGSLLGGLDLLGAGQVEVIRGPQSTVRGGAAIGGVVSLDAAPGRGAAHGTAEFEGGSFESWRGRALVAGGNATAGVSAAFTVNGTENQREPNGWRQRTQLLRVDYRPADRVSVGATFRGLQQRYSDPGDLRTSNTTPEGTTTFDNSLATVWLDARALPGWRSRLTAGGQEQFTKGTGRFNGGDEFVFTQSISRRVLDWQNTVTVLPRISLVAGLNREWTTAWTDGAALDERLFAGYADASWTPADALTLTAGARSDDYNTFDNAVTWRVAGSWHPGTGDTRLRASYGTGFMPPSLAARFGSVFENPNPGIRPERSRGWDAGIDQQLWNGDATVSVTWFRNALRDLIAYVSAPFPEKGQEVNVARARTHGLEVSGRVTRGVVDARAAYTLLRAVSLSEEDPSLERLIRRPRHTFSADLAVTPTAATVIGAGANVVANRQDTDFNAFPSARVNPGDYALLRLYASRRLRVGLELRARIDNLLDRVYEPVYGFPGLGRSFSGSVAVRF